MAGKSDMAAVLLEQCRDLNATIRQYEQQALLMKGAISLLHEQLVQHAGTSPDHETKVALSAAQPYL